MGNQISVDDISAMLSPIFAQYRVRRAVLFGSFAKGTATDASDLDLLVDSGLHGLRFLSLADAVSRAAERPVDLFDVTHIESGSRIEEEIKRTGVTIYAG